MDTVHNEPVSSSRFVCKMDSLPSYESYNNEASETILFIHSLFSSAKEWRKVAEYIEKKPGKRSFHILLTSLQSNQISNLEHCISLLTNLIRTKAKNGKAHIVGLSIGGHIAVLLAERYPELVETLNISGYNRFSMLSRRLLPFGIYLLRYNQSLYENVTRFSLAESYGVADILLSSNTVTAIPMRTLIIVGMRRILFRKHADSPKAAKALAKAISNDDQEIEVKGGRKMGHCWNRGKPKVYASTVVAWIEGTWPLAWIEGTEPEDLSREFDDL